MSWRRIACEPSTWRAGRRAAPWYVGVRVASLLAALASPACSEVAPERASPGGSSSPVEPQPSVLDLESSGVPSDSPPAYTSDPGISPLLTRLGVGLAQPVAGLADQGPAPSYILDSYDTPIACRFRESLRSVKCVALPWGGDYVWRTPLSDATPWLIRSRQFASELLEITAAGPRLIALLGRGGVAYPYEGVLFARQGNDLLRWDNMTGGGTASRDELGDAVHRVEFLAGSILVSHGAESARVHTMTLAPLRSTGPLLKGESRRIGARLEPPIAGVDCGGHGALVLSDQGNSKVLFVSSTGFELHDLGVRIDPGVFRRTFSTLTMTCSSDGVVISDLHFFEQRLDEFHCEAASCTRETVDLSRRGTRAWGSVPLGDKTLIFEFDTKIPHPRGTPAHIPYFRLAKLAELPAATSRPLLADGLDLLDLCGVRLHATTSGALVVLPTSTGGECSSPGAIYVVRITPEGKVEKVEREP